MKSKLIKTDSISIIPGIQEQRALFKLDNENKDSRLQIPSFNDDGLMLLNRPMNKRFEGICIPNGVDHEFSKLPDLCTYGGVVRFFGNNTDSYDPSTVWSKIVDFINYSNTQVDYEDNPEKIKRNFFIVSHHGTLKKCILPYFLELEKKLNEKKRRSVANCCCFLLEHINNEWILKLVFDGFPDKDKQYYELQNIDSAETIFKTDNPKILENLKQVKNTRIFLIRHGNAMHNNPLKLKGHVWNRISDTNLTPLGIYQARILSKHLIKKGYLHTETDRNVNFFCGSTMNRSQHTVLELVYSLNNEFSSCYPKLLNLERIFTIIAVFRIIRKSGNMDKFKDNIDKLITWNKNYSNESVRKKYSGDGKPNKLKDIINEIINEPVILFENGKNTIHYNITNSQNHKNRQLQIKGGKSYNLTKKKKRNKGKRQETRRKS
tara:strand:+ start:14531 stop:15832 length:1302 start_codon:yes stop_codon:yes gene_type:complete